MVDHGQRTYCLQWGQGVIIVTVHYEKGDYISLLKNKHDLLIDIVSKE